MLALLLGLWFHGLMGFGSIINPKPKTPKGLSALGHDRVLLFMGTNPALP